MKAKVILAIGVFISAAMAPPISAQMNPIILAASQNYAMDTLRIFLN